MKWNKDKVFQYLKKIRKDESGFTKPDLMFAGAIILGYLTILIVLIPLNQDTEESAVTEPAVTEPASPPTESLNEPLITALPYIIIALAVLGFSLSVARKVKSSKAKRLAKKYAESVKIEKWDTVRQQSRTILAEIHAYTTDIALAIKYPNMNNPDAPMTRVMLDSMQNVVRVLDKVNDEGVGGSDELLRQLSDATRQLTMNKHTAEIHAKKVALSNMGYQDRKDFKKAKKLLKKVTSRSNSESHRDKYMMELKAVIHRINERNTRKVISTESIRVLEDKVYAQQS